MNIFETAAESWNYAEFVQMLEALMLEGKTTGNNQSADYLHYAKLNLQRMHRWDKTFEPDAGLVAILQTQPLQEWWVITEGWCGDSAQNLPGIAKLAAAAEGKVQLRIVLRDDNPQIMDQYLTNGTSRSIPILVAFDKTGNELFRWGPRPKAAQDLLIAWKNNPAPASFEDFEKEMHTWYARDKGNTLQGEIRKVLEK